MARLELQRGDADEAVSFARRMLADHEPIAARLARIVPASVARVAEREGVGDRLALTRLKLLPPADLISNTSSGKWAVIWRRFPRTRPKPRMATTPHCEHLLRARYPLREHLQIAFEDARRVGGGKSATQSLTCGPLAVALLGRALRGLRARARGSAGRSGSGCSARRRSEPPACACAATPSCSVRNGE